MKEDTLYSSSVEHRHNTTTTTDTHTHHSDVTPQLEEAPITHAESNTDIDGYTPRSDVHSYETNTPPNADHEESDLIGRKNTPYKKKSLVLEGYRYLNDLEIHEAVTLFHNARLLDMNDQELEALYVNTNFLIKKITTVNTIANSIEKGDTLIEIWYEFIKKQKEYVQLSKHSSDGDKRLVLSEDHIARFRHVVITLALICYKNILKSSSTIKNNLEFRLKIYRCHKLLKEYHEALHIMQGICNKHNAPLMYSELADCYFLTNNTNNAKLIFREVFFMNPSEVQLHHIEASIIHDVVRIIEEEQRYSEGYIKDWIPVYGYTTNVFNISRELKPIELHNILNDIMNMEAKLEDHKALGNDDPHKILPALINRYFWLLEYYKKHDSESNHAKIELIISNIQKFDNFIYQKFLETNKK